MSQMEFDNLACIIPRLGGKRLLAPQIVEKMPVHRFYGEVFAGGASVFFRKKPSLFEVINDIDGDLINFYRVVKTKPFDFLQEMYLSFCSREVFFRYLSELKDTGFTEVQRAVRYYYVIKMSFGALGRTYGVTATSKPKINFVDLDHTILTAYMRFRRVTIENLSWEKFIPMYDRPDAFLYLDPPYRCKTAKDYPAWLTDEDFKNLAAILSAVKGKFLLSINDDEYIRSLFKKFKIEKIETTYSLNKNSSKKVVELLISNF